MTRAHSDRPGKSRDEPAKNSAEPAILTGEERTTWAVTLPGEPVTLEFEPADPDRDTSMIHYWMNEPHVVPWWQLDQPIEGVREYLAGLSHLTPWVVSADGTPFGYIETYQVIEDPLASYFAARPTDLGWHVLVGPVEMLGTGTPRLMGRAMLAYLLNRTDRVLCEPDVRNHRMLAFCRRLGHEHLTDVDLPAKRAALMSCTRGSFDARWPGDRAAVSGNTQ